MGTLDIFELFDRPALIQLFDQVDFSFYFMMIWAFRMDFRKTNVINQFKHILLS